jgi:uncharacterized membrane protein YbhN (UPF0104 family)
LVRKIVYLVVIVLLAWFLIKIGVTPWQYAMSNWHVVIMVMFSTGAGIVIQAQAFRQVSISPMLPLQRSIAIWSAASVVSVVAPLFAGIATRTVLLIQSGMSFSVCVLTSIRHVWMGLEYALLLGVFSLFFVNLPFSKWAAAGSLIAWAIMLTMRMVISRRYIQVDEITELGRWGVAINSLHSRVPLIAHPWFMLQILTMAATYFLAFNGMGADLNFIQAIALSAVTVALSLIVFVPNGLGITDALWVLVAAESGLVLEQAVAVAIVMRLAHLLASVLMYLITKTSLGRFGITQ